MLVFGLMTCGGRFPVGGQSFCFTVFQVIPAQGGVGQCIGANYGYCSILMYAGKRLTSLMRGSGSKMIVLVSDRHG